MDVEFSLDRAVRRGRSPADWSPDDPLRYYWRPLPLPIQPSWPTVAKQNGD